MLFRIDFYAPASRSHETIYRLESTSPFMPLQRGDLVNPRAWGPSANKNSFQDKFQAGCVLRVGNLEHFFFEVDDELIHAIGVLLKRSRTWRRGHECFARRAPSLSNYHDETTMPTAGLARTWLYGCLRDCLIAALTGIHQRV